MHDENSVLKKDPASLKNGVWQRKGMKLFVKAGDVAFFWQKYRAQFGCCTLWGKSTKLSRDIFCSKFQATFRVSSKDEPKLVRRMIKISLKIIQSAFQKTRRGAESARMASVMTTLLMGLGTCGPHMVLTWLASMAISFVCGACCCFFWPKTGLNPWISFEEQEDGTKFDEDGRWDRALQIKLSRLN